VGVVGILGALLLALTPLRQGSRPHSGVDVIPVELLRNGRFEGTLEDWGPAETGYEVAPSEGRSGSQALLCTLPGPAGNAGAFQTLRLDRGRLLPLRVSGWSRAHEVDGAPGDDYSLHASIEYQDGTRLDGVSVPFDCGTHGWQRRELRLPASKPIKTLVLHCLFRNHRGRVWFDDFSVEELRPEEGTILLEGTPLQPTDPGRRRSASPPRVFETNDGLRLDVVDESVRSLTLNGRESRPNGPSGFLIREAGREGAWQPLDATTLQELHLAFDSRWQASRDHVAIEGELRDLSGRDRAVSLAFALPVELEDGFWADDARRSRRILPEGEYANVVPVPCGSTGSLSRYPLGAVFDARIGVALAADMDVPAQFRVGYHAGLRELFLSYDFGILPDGVTLPGKARFRFVVYRIDPAEGFRGALQRLYSLFPAAFSRRCLEAGAWLPFTPPEKIPHWEDFGFAFHETTEPDAPAAAALPRRFRYREPLGFWLSLPPDWTRSQDELLWRLRLIALLWPQPLDLLERRVMKTPAGLPQFRFRREPWCDGVVFSMNPNPRLPGAFVSVDGSTDVFIDSVEGYAMADLDFDREHLRHATVSPTFSIDTRVPVLFKGQAIHEYAKEVARKLRSRNRMTFGNGTPERFSFLAPHFDVLGTEVDWFGGGAFVPPSDADLIFRRTLAYQKPYCILLNTMPSNLTPENLERYFQRCLFYGMFPSLFSHDAQNDSYWEDPARIERDRPLFKKYVPLIRRTSVAGWQPLTGACCDNPAILLERFGPDARGVMYLALLNDGPTDQEGGVTLDPPRQARERPAEARELITELSVPIRDRKFRIAVPAGACRLIELRQREPR
jgi:hypothetical protein